MGAKKESKIHQSLLEKKFEEIEVKNFVQQLEEIIDLQTKNAKSNINGDFSLVPPNYRNPTITSGKHFSIPNMDGIVTLIYEVYSVIDYKTLSKYYNCESVESGIFEDDNGIMATTYFIDDPQEEGNQLIVLQFDTNNNKVFINMGILLRNEVRFSKKLSVYRFPSFTNKSSLESIYLSDAAYNLKSFPENYMNDDLTTTKINEEIVYEVDIRKAPAIIIDPTTGEQIKREIYYDEEQKCLKAQIKIEEHKNYFAFKLFAKNGLSIQLTELEIGEYFREGKYGFPKDLFKAVQYFEKDGSAQALFEIACIFREESSVKDNELYFEYLCKSAELKYSRAIVELSLCVYNNETNIKEFQECLSLFDSLDENYAPGVFVLGYFIEKCMIDSRNMDDAFNLYIKSALKDYKPAQVRLQCCSLNEVELQERKDLYNRFINSLYEQDILFYCLGSIYFFGIGVIKRKQEGISLLWKAANLNNIDAQYTLFEIYDRDEEYNDKKEALKLLKKVAEKKGSVRVELANRLIDGIGCEISEENYKQAFCILEQVASTGDKIAMNNLGWMYMNGKGCDIDYVKAIELFERAAYLGLGTSYRHLGEMYEKGLGMSVNIEKAKRYYYLASEKGNERAKQRLKELESIN